ncbi:hypothetical protein [Amycolatopsis sp. NPDC050768]|uniref:hypothetical protein n=1 Tax=Amycolatopsis sp. NPDC050768 TaxID=3154839 RepID=UPI0033F2AA5C
MLTAHVAAVRVWAFARPPSSRAIRAANTTDATIASIAGSRSTKTEPGAIVSMARASRGSIGGWST